MKTKPIKLKDGIKDMTIEEVYKQFEKFIYKACQSWRNTYSIDDLVQVAFIGLNKAYESYDIKKDVLFLTYAALIINNGLKMYNRKERKHQNNISMSNTFNDDDSLELGDIIHDDTDYEEVAIKNIECEKLKAAILKLDDRERRIIEEVS
ncbi:MULTISPECIES: sigma-70 family RNA polymerase sigma factor [unclassified Clostridium]|uniref:sigma-70 family RNA polymerase sigma factor n=1 Tax=unclassified Clostridium TaxID=2614128 RepID=UPI0025BA48C7|nr:MULTISPECIES: sigma-70 family RNA polymerase sigma factor [unclassified Clostridium]